MTIHRKRLTLHQALRALSEGKQVLVKDSDFKSPYLLSIKGNSYYVSPEYGEGPVQQDHFVFHNDQRFFADPND